MQHVNRSKNERQFGAVLGLIGVLAGVLVGLLLTPIMLKYLDKSYFGLYQLIGSFAGYFTLMDFGISGTLSRYIAKYQVEGDKIQQDNLFSMCIIIYFVIGILLLGIGYGIYQNLSQIFKYSLTPEELALAKIMFVIVLGSVFTTVLSRAYMGAINGCERFIFSRVVTIVTMLLRISVIASILICGKKVVGVVVGEAIISLLILTLNFIYARFELKIRFKLHYWDWQIFVEVMSYAFWLFLGALVLQINFRLGGVLLGIMTTTSLVAVYAIAMQINTIYNALPSAIAQVFLPKATRLVIDNASGEELTRFMIGPSRYQLMLLGGLLSGFLLLGRQFITFWAGPKYIEAWTVGILVLIPVTIPLFQNMVLQILQAKALIRTRSLINLALAVTNAVISIFLVRAYGLLGPAIGTAIVLSVGHGVILNLYYHYGVGLNMILFFRETCNKILPTIIISLILGITVIYLPVGNCWSGLIIRGMLFSAMYAILMWLYGMNVNERLFFKSIFRDCIKIISPTEKKQY
jgi:O-antigen/teichoic acid export membrane protein